MYADKVLRKLRHYYLSYVATNIDFIFVIVYHTLLGIATRQCNQDGDWEAPNVTECRTVEQIRLEMRAEELNTLVASTFVGDDRDLTEDFMPEVVVDIADELNEITNTSTPLLPNDVTTTANTLNIIIS